MIVCRNGHQQPAPTPRFCIHCGTTLDAARPGQPPPAPPGGGQQPAAPPQQHRPPQPPPQYPQQLGPQNLQPHYPYNHQPHVQTYQPPPPQPAYYPQPAPPPVTCYACGGYGQGLAAGKVVCKDCGWLRPLAPGYRIDSAAFAWAADAKAMAALRAVKPLNAAASSVSEKVGRRWIETTFNGVLLGEKQLPHIYWQAVRAARLLGMSHMPDVYLSGDQAWDCLTFGTDKDSFVVLGSAIAGSFRGDDLLFLLAREMGHCRAGHALWKSVIRFLLGAQGPSKGFMAGGLLSAIMSPTALIEGAIEVPLLAWARQAEITADRAGLLAVGDERIARRVLLTWSLKSVFIYRQINIEAWLEQQADDSEDNYSKLSELTTSSTPYITPRLKLLTEFAQSRELAYWRQAMAQAEAAQDAAVSLPAPAQPAAPAGPPAPAGRPQTAKPAGSAKPPAAATKSAKRAAPAKPKATAGAAAPPADPAQSAKPAKSVKTTKPAGGPDAVRLKCASCQTAMRVPPEVLAGKEELPVKCPKCGKVTRLKKNVKPAAGAPEPPKPTRSEEATSYDD